MHHGKAIILFFSYTAAAEARHKNWCGRNITQNRQLAALLINRTLHTLRQSGLPVCHYHEHMQRGKSFGERLTHAFGDLFNQGYDSVIAVGNDTPGLRQVQWAQVAACLSEGRAVVGPDQRGGVYLMGITRDMWSQDFLESIRWNSGRVCEDLCAVLENARVLPAHRDLNDVKDISAYIRETPDDDLMIRFMTPEPPISTTQHRFITSFPAGTVSRRGPPKEWHASA